jgi:hypothetical protein
MRSPQIVSATIQLPDAGTWVHLGATNLDGAFSAAAEAKDPYFQGDTLVAAQPIRHKGEILGMLYLRANFDAMYRDLLVYYVVILAFVLLGCSVVAVLFSARLPLFRPISMATLPGSLRTKELQRSSA